MSDFQLQGQLLQKLYEAGELLWIHGYVLGTFLDWSGNGDDGVPTATAWEGKAITFRESTSKVTIPDRVGNRMTEGSLAVFSSVEFTIQEAAKLIAKRDAGGTNYDFALNNTALIIFDGIINRTVAMDIVGHKLIGINMPSAGGICEGFLDNASVGAFNGASTFTADDADITIGNRYSNDRQFRNSTQFAMACSRQLTDTEWSQLYDELEQISKTAPTITELVSNAHLLVDPYPTYGPELLADRMMEASGVGDWIPSASDVVTKETGTPYQGTQCLRVAYGGASNPLVRQGVLTALKKYRVRGVVRSDGTWTPEVLDGASSAKWTGTTSTSWQKFDVVFTQPSGSSLFYRHNATGAGYCEWDAMSVQEVHELAAGYNMRPVGGQLIDLSANRNDGTIYGASYEMTPLGDALRFDGVGDYTDHGNDSSLQVTDVTFSCWFNTDDVTTVCWLFDYYFGASDAWGLRIYSGDIAIYDDIDNAGAVLYSTSISVGLWYRVDVVMDSLENKLYLNGDLVGSGTSSSAAWSSFAGFLYLGKRHPTSGPYNGLMVLPEVHPEAKDQTWVTREYQRGHAAGWHSDWGVNESVAAVTAGNNLENSPIEVDSGEFKISMAPIGETPLGVEKLVDGDMEAGLGSELLTDGDMEAGLGPEEMTDGDMEAVGVAAYTPVSGAVLTKEIVTPHSGVQCLRVEITADNYGAAEQIILTVGKSYNAHGWYRGDAGDGVPSLRNGATTLITGTNSNSWQEFDVDFVAGTTDFELVCGGNVAGVDYAEFDDVSVKETCPDWTSAADALLTKSVADPHGGAQALRVAFNGTISPYARQTVTITGTSYHIGGWARGDGTYAPFVRHGTTVIWTGTASTSWQSFSVDFVTSSTVIRFYSNATAAGWVEFDDVTIRETCPAWEDPLNDPLVTKEIADPHSGLQCLRMTMQGTGTETVRQTVLTVGKKYCVTGWARAKDGDGNAPAIRDGSAAWLWTGISNNNIWTAFKVVFTAQSTNLRLYNRYVTIGWVEFDDVKVKEVIPDKKVIECVSAGICYIPTAYLRQTPTEAAYGEWKFYWNKADLSSLTVSIIHDQVAGPSTASNYNFIHRVTDIVDFRKETTVVIDGGVTVYTPDVWHVGRITRLSDGEFELFIDDVSVGTGTDATYTVSNYIVVELDAGDKIAYSDRRGDYSIKKRILV